jgi:hypothetical protein
MGLDRKPAAELSQPQSSAHRRAQPTAELNPLGLGPARS